MLNNIKRFIEKINFYFGKKSLTNINNNQNNNNMLQIIKPGHYCSNETLNSDSKDIIRIIGPDKNREGYWITDSGKNLHETHIINSYVPLDTKPTEKQDIKKFDIMAGFKPTVIEEFPIELIEDNKPVTEISKPIYQEVKPKPENPFSELETLISKAHIDSLNKNYKKTHGIEPYKSTSIEIPITIEIPYDINKLLQISELFDIDKNTLIQYLLTHIELPKVILKSKLDYLLTDTMVDNTKHTTNFNTKPLPIEIPSNDDLTLGIQEIDEYISKITKIEK